MITTTLTPGQVRLVRESFGRIAPIADVAGALIYERIFFLAPEARGLFGDDIAAQGARLMHAVARAVEALDRPEELRPFLERLGERHVRYGVVPAHFEVVGAAVMWALGQGLGEHFTKDVSDAWATVFGSIQEAMLVGMSRVSQPA
jgi:hemoglobin-like flavoprotein